MTEEREDYMRRQEADHDLLRMRDPNYKPRIENRGGGNYVVTGYPLTERMKLLGITGMVQTLGGGWQIETPNGKTYAPQEVAVWLAEKPPHRHQREEAYGLLLQAIGPSGEEAIRRNAEAKAIFDVAVRTLAERIER